MTTDDELMSTTVRGIKRFDPPNRMSKRQRSIALTPLEILELNDLVPLALSLTFVQCASLLDLLLIDSDELGSSVSVAFLALWARVFEVLSYSNFDMTPVRARGTKVKAWQSIESCLTKLGTVRDFDVTFGVSPTLCVRLVELLFPPNHVFTPAPITKQERFGALEGLLLLLAKLRNNLGSAEAIGRESGRSEGFVCSATRMITEFLYDRYKHLLDFAVLGDFEHHVPEWRRCIAGAYARTIEGDIVDSLPEQFTNVSCFVDCMRMSVARPSRNQNIAYSGYTGDHNITRIVVTAPDGLIIASPPAMSGHHNDMSVANHYNLNANLSMHGMKALADKGFLSAPGVLAALPKEGEVHYIFPHQSRALAAIRTTGVECPFGQLKGRFPYLTQAMKQKVYQTAPGIYSTVAMILQNIIVLENGTNGTLFFDCRPQLTSAEYLAFEVH